MIRKLDIEVEDGGWGEASIDDIMAVLDSVADELTEAVRPLKVEPILVKHNFSEQIPRVLYKRSQRGKIIIKLSSSDLSWSQYAYQFSHELCHVLSNYKDNSITSYEWLEESICELASLFTLRKMAKSWGTSPPYQNWSEYAPNLNSYVQNRINDSAQRLPLDMSFLTWFTNHHARLKDDGLLRGLNGIIALQLLPLFEEDIYAWQAIRYLNMWDIESDKDLTQFFESWSSVVTQEIRPSVNRIAKHFGILIASKISPS